MLVSQFLSHSFKSDSSIRNYISGVKALHTLLALPFPATGSELRLVLGGIQRLKSRPPRQASLITLSLLKDIFSLLDLTQPTDSVFGCLFLMAFYILARKSNLMASSIAGRHRPNKQILCSDVQLSSAGLLVTGWVQAIGWSLFCNTWFHLVPSSGLFQYAWPSTRSFTWGCVCFASQTGCETSDL